MADDLVVREWDIRERDIWVDTGSTRFQLRPDIAVKEHNALANELADIRRAYLERDAQLAEALAKCDLQKRAGYCDADNLSEPNGKITCGWERRAEAAEAQLAAMTAERDTYREMAKTRDDALAAMRAERDAEAARRKWAEDVCQNTSFRDGRRIQELIAQLTASEAARGIGAEIMRIMATYREQEAERGYVDTPGGLEHMGDVWKLLGRWDNRLRALAEPGKAGEP